MLPFLIAIQSLHHRVTTRLTDGYTALATRRESGEALEKAIIVAAMLVASVALAAVIKTAVTNHSATIK